MGDNITRLLNSVAQIMDIFFTSPNEVSFKAEKTYPIHLQWNMIQVMTFWTCRTLEECAIFTFRNDFYL